MLTKQDLVDAITPLDEKIEGVKQEIGKLRKAMNRGFKKVHDDNETIIKFTNEEVIDLKKRVEVLELKSPPNL